MYWHILAHIISDLFTPPLSLISHPGLSILPSMEPFHISSHSPNCHPPFLKSLPPGYRASIPPGPWVYFLFVLAKGATCPGRPTAWSLPAVSTWHKLARWAGLQLRRPSAGAYIDMCTQASTHSTRSRQCRHLPSTTMGHKVMWCKMINELVKPDVIIKNVCLRWQQWALKNIIHPVWQPSVGWDFYNKLIQSKKKRTKRRMPLVLTRFYN